MSARAPCSRLYAELVCEVEAGSRRAPHRHRHPKRRLSAYQARERDMSDPLYRKELLRLAADARGAGRLTRPHGTATAHNPACGDRVTVDVALEDGRIAALAHHDPGLCADPGLGRDPGRGRQGPGPRAALRPCATG